MIRPTTNLATALFYQLKPNPNHRELNYMLSAIDNMVCVVENLKHGATIEGEPDDLQNKMYEGCVNTLNKVREELLEVTAFCEED